MKFNKAKLWLVISIFTILIIFPQSLWADRVFELEVDGISCAFCARGLEKKLKRAKIDVVDIKINEGVKS